MGATLDAPEFRRAMILYARALEAHREELDSLNVFPVPDGDPGTNLLLTQRAVEEACAGLEAFPHLEVEVHRGDQPRAAYLVAVE